MLPRDLQLILTLTILNENNIREHCLIVPCTMDFTSWREKCLGVQLGLMVSASQIPCHEATLADCIGEVCVYLCLYVRLFVWTTYHKFQMSAFKYFTMIACLVHAVTCTSAKPKPNERGGLLPDCRFGVKESESEDHFIRMRWQHTWQFTF